MHAFAIEHSPARYYADFIAYALAVATLAAWLALRAPAGLAWYDAPLFPAWRHAPSTPWPTWRAPSAMSF